MNQHPESYAEQFCDWLVDLGYTHCFFLAGGNIMHLLNVARTRFTCIPVVHEVTAGIATEYFNASRQESSGRAFAMVTAGPGLTNILTAMAGAFLESRELLVVGGQVKSSDLATPAMRQRGIQEVDGIALAQPVTKQTLQIRVPEPRASIEAIVLAGRVGRKGPVFLEFCLDAQAAPALDDGAEAALETAPGEVLATDPECSQLRDMIGMSKRPVLLLGGGISRARARELLPELHRLGMPVATSWNALDRIDYEDPLNVGRPDTWGMRWSNIVIQQADLVIAAGARLSLQQTGFNWQSFAPLASVVHIDLDESELHKGHPQTDLGIQADAVDTLLRAFAGLDDGSSDWDVWREFIREVQAALPLDDPENIAGPGFLSPYAFADWLSTRATAADVLIPCSSGGASTSLMQAFRQKSGQVVLNDKALASMGYGLAGAIGAAFAHSGRRVLHVEGDGGFAQNLQDLGTVAMHALPIKTFIFANDGYASIRMTQRNYFDGAWVGCDASTGVGLPQWLPLFAAFGIPAIEVDAASLSSAAVAELLAAPGPAAFILSVDPEQSYFPKITSRVTPSGGMESNPLHLMTPALSPAAQSRVLPYLDEGRRS